MTLEVIMHSDSEHVYHDVVICLFVIPYFVCY